MTNKQKQALLSYLGYYVGAIDGIWGSGSRAAANAFRDDYGAAAEDKFLLAAVNGTLTPAPKASNGWEGIRYFTREEFQCRCGGKYCSGYPAEMDPEVVGWADAIRARFGKPAKVNSGLRCREWNRLQGGSTGSFHMTGKAIDLGTIPGTTAKQMYDYAETLLGGKHGLGLYSWGIHIDNGDRVWRG